MFATQARLLAQMRAARATQAYDRKLKQLARVDVLIIDDFGLRPLRSPEDEDFCDLIAERYERGSCLITSNLDWSEWPSAFPNKLLAAATLDRLQDGAYRVVLDGASHRKPRPLASDPAASIPEGKRRDRTDTA